MRAQHGRRAWAVPVVAAAVAVAVIVAVLVARPTVSEVAGAARAAHAATVPSSTEPLPRQDPDTSAETDARDVTTDPTGPDAPTDSAQTTTPPSGSADPAETTTSTSGTEPAPEASGARLDPADPMAWGEVDARVVMVWFFDYQCVHCATWSEQTLPVMLELVETGDLRIELRPLPLLGDDSELAARAAQAAARQDGLLEFHELMFADGQPQQGLTEDLLVDLAVEAGLDAAQFRVDLGDEDVAAAVRADHDAAEDLEVSSTPTFLINGTELIGSQTPEIFVEAFERALAGS